MSIPTQSQLCQVFVQEQIQHLHTKEGDTGIIFGSRLDLLNERLAWNCKKFNVELAFDNVHCLNIWTGKREWTDTIFNEEKTLNKHCLRLIEDTITNLTTKDRNTELSAYRMLDDYAVFKLWNRLHPQNTKTFPRHTWLNNVGDLDAAGHPVVLDPPLADRTDDAIPFAFPGFDIHDPDTWDILTANDFERAQLHYGIYSEHLFVRGFIFNQAQRNASVPYKKLRTIIATSPTAEIIKAARELNVHNSAFEQTQRDRMEHSSRLKDDEAKKKTMKALVDRIFGPTHQQSIGAFKQACDFNSIRLYFEEKYGVLTDSTMVIDEVRKALSTPSSYSKCTNVASIVNTWEMLCCILISLEHNHRGTPVANRPPDIHTIRSSLYKTSLSYTTDYPLTPRIISEADSRANLLFPFEVSRYSRLVREYKTRDKKKPIEDIKTVLEDEEDADHKDPQRSLSSGAPRAFMVHAPSEPGLDEFWSIALQDPKPHTLPSSFPPSSITSNIPSFEPFLTEEETEWNLHALAVFSENSTALLHTRPCPICIHIGRNRHPEERANAEKHSLNDCPILPKIAQLPNPNLQGYPTNFQASLPSYSSLLSRIKGNSTSGGVKREHSGQPKSLSSTKDSVRAQMLHRFQPANSRAHLAISTDSSLYSSFVPAGHQDAIESKEDTTYESGFLDPNA